MGNCSSRPYQNSGLLFVFGESSGFQSIPLNTNLLHRTPGYHQFIDNTQKILYAPAWKLIRLVGAANARIKPIKARGRRTELGMTKRTHTVPVETFCQHDAGQVYPREIQKHVPTWPSHTCHAKWTWKLHPAQISSWDWTLQQAQTCSTWSIHACVHTFTLVQLGQEHRGALRTKKTKTQERGGPGPDEEDWDRRTGRNGRINGLDPRGPEGPGKQIY